ncbi:MAG: AraC family transcriptional regulator [Anaerolineaceae bacterium]|nr:AraC family transcriptional regulator [Anaerolineaceae bacterium]
MARQTGFFDAFHFSKAFKKRCGISSSQFRQSCGAPTPRRAERHSGASALPCW